MEAPLQLEVTLGRPAVAADREPEEPHFARVRVVPRPELAVRPQLDLCFVLDASASMHRFVLDPQQRAYWQQRAEARGEVTRQQADGRTGMVWTGQTLRELQQHVSTPMLSTLRGVWRTLEALAPTDRVSVLAFADRSEVIYEDAGVPERGFRLETARGQLGRLGGGVDESGLGRGTRLAGALQHALDRAASQGEAPVVRRLLLVSDGVVEDSDACRILVEAAMERGIVLSVIGVGDDFDEEFLMQVADVARGSYYYAAAAPEVERAVTAELEIATQVLGRQGILLVRPESGTVLHDVFPTAPALSEFQTMWVENGGWRFRVGDFSAAQQVEFLLQFGPGAHPAGGVPVAAVRLMALAADAPDTFQVDASVTLFFADDPVLLQARDDEVLDTVKRLEVYREERRAAAAAAKGDSELATRHLRAATRMLRGLGADQLAEEMDAAAAESESGTKNLSRTKRVKASTRRLGQQRSPEPEPNETQVRSPGTRQLR